MHVQLDSRLIKQGDTFVPIKGETFDGHNYIEQAYANGAVGIIEEDELYRLAKEKLKKVSPTVIAVTGSVGKSSTTSFLYQILNQQFKVCLGSLNTKLGLAVNIINELHDDTEIFVAECGMDRTGELTETGEFIQPDYVMLTNISESHLLKLGSLENIMKAKVELINSVKPNGILIVNGDSENIKEALERYQKVNNKLFRYYINHKDIELIRDDNSSDISEKRIMEMLSIKTLQELGLRTILGEHQKSNLIGALSVALQINGFDIKSVDFSKIQLPKGRMNIIEGINNSIIIDDTYNASPESTIAALESVYLFWKEKNNEDKNRKYTLQVILGGMLELGDFEDEGHIKVGDKIATLPVDNLLLVGSPGSKIMLSENLKKKFENQKTLNGESLIREFKDSDQLAHHFENWLDQIEQSVILVKGSQGVRMEKIVYTLMKNRSDAANLLARQDLRWVE